MKKTRFVTLFAAVVLASVATSSAFAQSSHGPGAGVAKTCRIEMSLGDKNIRLVGNGGKCGKGSYLSMRLRSNSVANSVTEQVCDVSRPITRTQMSPDFEDQMVNCIFMGDLDDPARVSGGWSFTIK